MPNDPELLYEMHLKGISPRSEIMEIFPCARRYMRAVAALGEDSGYNHLCYFEAPISLMPTEKMVREARSRWEELNNSGALLSALCDRLDPLVGK